MHSLTRSCFLLLLLGRLLLLALPFLPRISLPSPWSPPFPLHAPALISLSIAKVQFSPTLILSSLMIWCCGQTALFLFLVAKVAPAYLPTAHSVALRPLFCFWQAQYAQVFLLKPAPFCTLFAGLGGTIKSAISFFFSNLTLVLPSPPCPLLHLFFYLQPSDRYGRNCLLTSCSIKLQLVSRHVFLLGNNAADELASSEALLAPSAIPCSLFPVISRIHSSLFWDWRHTVSSKFFHMYVLSISTEELVLPYHTRCVLSRLCCNGHSLLLSSYLSRIDRIENPSCSACGYLSQNTSHLIPHCPAMGSLHCSLFGDSLSLYDLWSRH